MKLVVRGKKGFLERTAEGTAHLFTDNQNVIVLLKLRLAYLFIKLFVGKFHVHMVSGIVQTLPNFTGVIFVDRCNRYYDDLTG